MRQSSHSCLKQAMRHLYSHLYIRVGESVALFWRMHTLILRMLFHPDPPSLHTRPSKQTVLEDTNVTMRCSATGHPVPTITWYKEGKAIASGETLSLNGHRNVAGKYWCSADNGVGEGVNASVDIDVQCEYMHYTVEKYCVDNWWHNVIGKSPFDEGFLRGMNEVGMKED